MGRFVCMLLFASTFLVGTVKAEYTYELAVRGFDRCLQQTSFCTVKRDGARTGRQCCEACSCRNTCYEQHNCCPDISNATYAFDHTCHSIYYNNAAFRNRGIDSNDPNRTFELVSTCPDGSACTLEDDSSADDVSLADIVVVYSEEHEVLFLNKKCAECNGIQEMKRWKLVAYKCDLKYKRDWPTEELRRYILNDCVLVSEPTYEMKNIAKKRQCFKGPRRARAYISTCNETGQWESYEEIIESACLNEDFVFWLNTLHATYKNVYCFICNNPAGTSPTRCINVVENLLVEFSGILELNIEFFETGRGAVSEKKCDHNEFFDELFETCRPVTCAGPRMLSSDVCVVPFEVTGEEPEYFNLELDLVLTPLAVKNISSDMKAQDMESEELLQAILSLLQIPRFCGMKSLKSGTVFWNTRTFMLHSISLEISVGLSESDSGCTYERIVGAFESVKRPGDLNISFSIGGENVEFMVTPDNRTQTLPSQAKINPSLPEYDGLALQEISRNRFTESNILKVEPPFLCPYITLDESEYNKLEKQITSKSPTFPNESSSDCLSTTERIYVSNSGKYIKYYYICLSDYQIVSAKKQISPVASSLSGITSFILTCVSMTCTALVFMFLCLSKKFSNGPMVIFGIALLNLLIAQAVFQFGSGWKEIRWLCKAVGIAVHYFWLALVFSLNAYCVLILRNILLPNIQTRLKDLIMSILYVYGLPILFILINITVTNVNKEGEFSIGYGSTLCHINSALMRGLVFVLPILFTVVLNCVVNGVVMMKIRGVQEGVVNARRESHYLSVYFRLLMMTGLTWLFGFVNEFLDSIVLEYLFTISVGGQGILLFLSFVCRKSFIKEMRVKSGQFMSQSRTRNYTTE